MEVEVLRSGEARIRVKQIERMLRMLEGNIRPDDIKRLEREWLHPIAQRMEEIESKIT